MACLFANNLRKSRHNPSTVVPSGNLGLSSSNVNLAHVLLSMAWLGQHVLGIGTEGGLTLRPLSSSLQSPYGKQGGDRQESEEDGTQTWLRLQTFCWLKSLQFSRPHQTLVHLITPFVQRQVLHSCCHVTLFSRVWVFHGQLPGVGRYAKSFTIKSYYVSIFYLIL